MDGNSKDTPWMDRGILWIVFVPVVGIYLLFLAGLLYCIWPINDRTLAESGVFGDSFGALTALFSSLAFAGLLVSIYYQRRDLGLTQKELKDTRAEMQRQSRETNFFHLLRVHNEVLSQLDVKERRGDRIVDVATGRDCFDRFQARLAEHYEQSRQVGDEAARDPVRSLKRAFEKFYHHWGKDLGHYLRTVYNTLRFLREQPFDDGERKLYANIFRAQLSDPELGVILCNCLTERGEKLAALCTEFRLFDNLPESAVLDKGLLPALSESAFGDNEELLKLRSDALGSRAGGAADAAPDAP